MSKMKMRACAWALLACMLMTASCGGDGTIDETKNPLAGDETTSIELDREAMDFPEDLTFDGAVRILTAENILASPEELTDELNTLEAAKYKRTVAVEDLLGVELEFYTTEKWLDINNLARQSINADSDDYDMIFTPGEQQIILINEGLYLPLSELPYIDIEKPWWNKQYIDSTAVVEGYTYLLFGDITYNTIERTTCVYFNADLLESKLGLVADDLYDLVEDEEWTIDKFTELVNSVYEDNGDTKNDPEDIHGLTARTGGVTFGWMAFSSGLKFTDRDEDGYPVLALNNPRTNDLCEKLCKLWQRNPSVCTMDDANEAKWKFSNGKSLFMVERFYFASWEQMDVMKDDYGILPMPKYDESIDGYHSVVEELVQWGAVPVTISDPAKVSATAEALAYYSRLYTTPAYYEITLKLKETRDDRSMEIIDLITAGSDTDFLFINDREGMGGIFKDVCNSGQNSFASKYAGRERAAKTKINKLVKAAEDVIYG